MRFLRNAINIILPGVFILFLSACGGGGGSSSPPPPTTTTTAATGISLHEATINGTVNPHAQATTALFEWGTDNALAAPTLTAAQPVGSGSADNTVSAALTGLNFGTTYYYRVSATNASGTQKGAIASFTTASPNSPPSVTTEAASSVTISSATLNGTVIPNELATSAAFKWGTDSNLVGASTTTAQDLGAGTTSVAITAPLTGLTPGVKYYFQVTATNSAGTSTGVIGNFTAVAQAPTVTTGAASSITITGLTLNGSVNPNGLAVTNAHFEYGTDPNLVGASSTSAQTLAAGFTAQALTPVPLTGLTPGVTYYFRAVATNSAGPTNGLIVSQATEAQAPTVVTAAADNISITGSTLHGTVNPNGLAVTDYHFEYGTDSNLVGASSTTGQTLAAGLTAQPVTALLSGLAPGTTYYFRVVATNSVGTLKGLILSFNTVAPPPTVVTSAATSVTTTGATLNGTVNPNGLATDAYFEYGTDPTLAINSTTSTQSKGSGGTAVAITASLSSLTPGTKYYFRVVATNAGGTSRGAILSFPNLEVTTKVPTSITTTSVIFNGSVTPNGLQATAWFEYGTDSALASPLSTLTAALGTGFTPVSYNKSVSGLSSYTTYYYRAVASNTNGTQRGLIKSFKTGETYVAVGDSITAGSDGTENIGGYEPILADLLGVMISNEGVSGKDSAYGVGAIAGTLADHPSAQYYLIMYGTNDAFIPAVDKNTYKSNMQAIITAVKNAGKTPYLAKVPYTTDVLRSDASIQEYNAAIDELVADPLNGISVVPPDFYTLFKSDPSQLNDGIHPNATGYQSMATLWFNVLP